MAFKHQELTASMAAADRAQAYRGISTLRKINMANATYATNVGLSFEIYAAGEMAMATDRRKYQ